MQQKITLRQARRNRGLSLKEASRKVDVKVDELERYEMSPGKTPYDIAIRLKQLYRISLDHIDFGV